MDFLLTRVLRRTARRLPRACLARPSAPFSLSAATLSVLVLAGCAAVAPGSTASSTTSATAAVGPGLSASAPGGAASAPSATRPPEPLKPFAEVIRDAARQDGFVPLWRKDEKVWLEIPAERIGEPFLLSVNIANSVGERGLYASQMGPRWLAEFRRIGNQLQLVAKNTQFRGTAGDRASLDAVRQGFSDSLLGSATVLSLPHPTRKSFLVDAGFLLSDLPAYSTRLERAYRLPYGLDRGNSYFEAVRAEAKLTTLSAQLHFATPRIPAPPLVAPPTPTPTPPTTTPDPRSLFVGTVLSFAALPDQPMTPRRADPRLGHFTEAFTDLGGDMKADPRVHHVKRWRLDKQDPQAALSPPKQPIVYWLDRNIPARYRGAVEAGILEWNKAFERIGFKDAIVVRQQPDDADFDTLDAGHASVRWFTGADVGFAIGPSHADPRTGQILDADIGMSDVFGRGSRRFIVEDVGRPAGRHDHTGHGHAGEAPEHCTYAEESAHQMHFALDLLEARGDLAPDSPEAEAFVQAVIKDTMMHEVGHTLGLKHNFKASTTVSRAQLLDKAFTETHGISGSVMDYNAYNLPLRGEQRAAFNNSTLGAYDYWVIEYAYKPLAPDQEAAELKRIAERSSESALVFADDGDADSSGLDPLANRFDLGDDPLAYYRKRLTLSKELWTRVQARAPQPGDDALRQRRSLLSGFRQIGPLPELAAKYVGGMHTARVLPGSGQPVYKPVDPARQREALQFLAEGIFSVDSFSFKPEFLASMGPNYIEWDRAEPVNIPTMVLGMQTRTLDRLLSAGTAQRVLDLPAFLPEHERRGLISLHEVYGSLQSTIWSELKSGRDIDRMRRNLQREHLKRVQALLTRGSATLPADALSLMRLHATELQAGLRQAVARKSMSIESRAHLQESLGSLTEALRATMQRS